MSCQALPDGPAPVVARRGVLLAHRRVDEERRAVLVEVDHRLAAEAELRRRRRGALRAVDAGLARGPDERRQPPHHPVRRAHGGPCELVELLVAVHKRVLAQVVPLAAAGREQTSDSARAPGALADKKLPRLLRMNDERSRRGGQAGSDVAASDAGKSAIVGGTSRCARRVRRVQEPKVGPKDGARADKVRRIEEKRDVPKRGVVRVEEKNLVKVGEEQGERLDGEAAHKRPGGSRASGRAAEEAGVGRVARVRLDVAALDAEPREPDAPAVGDLIGPTVPQLHGQRRSGAPERSEESQALVRSAVPPAAMTMPARAHRRAAENPASSCRSAATRSVAGRLSRAARRGSVRRG